MAQDIGYLKDVYSFQFKDLMLHQWLKSWDDKIAFRNVVHEYLQRDGAEIQRMGRKAAEFSFKCFYLGPAWRVMYEKLVNSLSDDNTGPLIHPLLGQFRAAADVITSSVTPATGRNLIEFTIQFTEDRVDATFAVDAQLTPSQQAAKVMDLSNQVAAQGTMMGYQSAAMQSLTAYVAAAQGYAAAAEAAANTLALDPSLALQLATTGADAQAAIQAILLDPATYTNCAAWPALTLVEQCYAAAIELDNALRQLRPQPELVRVDAAIGLITLCEARYGGKDAPAYMDLALLYNRIPNPWLIPPGTDLLLPPRTWNLPQLPPGV